jgi:hypothetical protein
VLCGVILRWFVLLSSRESWLIMRSFTSRASAVVRRSVVAVVLFAALAMSALAVAPAANAASGAHVAVGANARSCVSLSSCLMGQVAYDGSGSTYQVSDMSCWWDGASYNGSPRWFKVYVQLTSGYVGWLFVHSSFVGNQPGVPKCGSGSV